MDPVQLVEQVLIISVSLLKSSTLTESIIMIGMALLTKYVIRNMSKKLKQGCISHSFHYKGQFNSCTLVARWKASILKVGVAPVY